MKKQFLLPATVMVLILFIMSSCSKSAIDFDHKDSDLKYSDFKRGNIDLGHADLVHSGCRVRQVINRQSDYFTLTRNFEYNKNNDPVSVKSNAAGTAQPDLYFTYDKKGRLIEYYGLYSGGQFFEFLHRYGYTDDKITVDTTYIWGEYPNPTTYYSKRIKYLKYDALDRVVYESEVYVYPNYEPMVFTYNYDNNGNLTNNVGTYDNQISPRRTNKIWMFVDRNYSVNNRMTADSYSANGLPLKFTAPGYDQMTSFAYMNYYKSAEFVYDCIEHGKKFR